MGLLVWEDGESECRSVIERTGAESIDNIASRESGPTSIWSLITRELD
jgi:hypothetical protein